MPKVTLLVSGAQTQAGPSLLSISTCGDPPGSRPLARGRPLPGRPPLPRFRSIKAACSSFTLCSEPEMPHCFCPLPTPTRAKPFLRPLAHALGQVYNPPPPPKDTCPRATLLFAAAAPRMGTGTQQVLTHACRRRWEGGARRKQPKCGVTQTWPVCLTCLQTEQDPSSLTPNRCAWSHHDDEA